MQCKKWANFSKKRCLHFITLTLAKLKYFMSYNKIVLLTRRRSELGSRNRLQIIFRNVWTKYMSIYKKCWSKDEFFVILIKLRLDLLFNDFSQRFGIYLVVFALKFFIHGHAWSGKKWLKVRHSLKPKTN